MREHTRTLGMNNNNLPQARHLLKRLENEWTQLCSRHARLGSSCQWNLPGTQPASLAEALARTGYRPDKRSAATLPGFAGHIVRADALGEEQRA